MKKSIRIILTVLILSLIMIPPAMAQKQYKFKISVDTVMNHPRNQALLLFIDDLKKMSENRLVPELFHSGQLYKDRAVPKALRLGTLDMGIPGMWYLASFDVNTTITTLPMFYGQSAGIIRETIDGKFGKAIVASLEKKMKVKVLGGFYEAGYVDTFTLKKPIRKLEDFKGLKIRYPGSPANALRIKAFGGSPIAIPYGDVPMALMQGTVDGLLSIFKTVEGGKLYESGIKYAVKENGTLQHYIPMVSLNFWNSLPKDLQSIMIEAWNKNVPKQREFAVNMQVGAEATLEKNEIEIYRPSKEQLKKWRNHFMKTQDEFVEDQKLDKTLVELGKKNLGM